ncbi:MAG TPA: hypothetical protein VMF89_12340, partial [Polyangiales bacterium]|nr:hypothetical protein [Polyangiales bacterium]
MALDELLHQDLKSDHAQHSLRLFRDALAHELANGRDVVLHRRLGGGHGRRWPRLVGSAGTLRVKDGGIQQQMNHVGQRRKVKATLCVDAGALMVQLAQPQAHVQRGC